MNPKLLMLIAMVPMFWYLIYKEIKQLKILISRSEKSTE